jgi:hypothetical protein
MAALVGALILSQGVDDPELSDEILHGAETWHVETEDWSCTIESAFPRPQRALRLFHSPRSLPPPRVATAEE